MAIFNRTKSRANSQRSQIPQVVSRLGSNIGSNVASAKACDVENQDAFVNRKSRNCHLVRLLLTVVSVLFILSACNYAPVQEMSNARQAIQAAKINAVNEIALQSIRLAEQHLYKATLALDIGDYGNARENANTARELALEVQRLSSKFARVF